jgi:hypothetical protein
VAAGKRRLARRKLEALTRLVQPARKAGVDFGFNEHFRAQDGVPCGQDWQTWSAAMYLYAARCVEQNQTPFFDEIRSHLGYQSNRWKRGDESAGYNSKSQSGGHLWFFLHED